MDMGKQLLAVTVSLAMVGGAFGQTIDFDLNRPSSPTLRGDRLTDMPVIQNQRLRQDQQILQQHYREVDRKAATAPFERPHVPRVRPNCYQSIDGSKFIRSGCR